MVADMLPSEPTRRAGVYNVTIHFQVEIATQQARGRARAVYRHHSDFVKGRISSMRDMGA